MAGIIQKSCVALFPLWSHKKNSIRSLNLIRSHVVMTTVMSLKSGLNLDLKKNEKRSPIARCASENTALMYYE